MADPEEPAELIRLASGEISKDFKALVACRDLDSIRQLQNLTLGRLQDSNAMLSQFNVFSENRFVEVSDEFSKNTRLLRSMKSDLDYVYQKLRGMKAKIMQIHPDAFPDDSTIEALDQRPNLELPR
ncbi:uncharacterized protein LOC127250012 [Andrographis paniculata]|uniref:uncharacterized protein LOC127250012 n=1 Tax=Andrographis paniculata TaxID=175694 RepID=UPI0021E70547|nr:uncharacterized protein LOC127250012 [Andrographis paniculata]